jgi:hypothetical protein
MERNFADEQNSQADRVASLANTVVAGVDGLGVVSLGDILWSVPD